MISSRSFQINSREGLIALNAVPGLSPRSSYNLSQAEDCWQRVINASSSEAANLLGIPEKTVVNLRHFPFDEFYREEMGRAEAAGARIVTLLDKQYPKALKEIPDPPLVIYVKGALPENDDVFIAIVGSRGATAYGLGIGERFAMRLVEAGVGIISGMARGIDAAAHWGALKARGRTIGVLGCGLDVVYPSQNSELYKEVSEKGCLITEFPMGTEPLPYHFPRRNRIVSALSYGVVVVEANARSGALITAEFALEQGRDVYAVPGRIDSPQSRGPHELLRQGARLVLDVNDILEDIPALKSQLELFPQETVKAQDDLTADELRVLKAVREGRISFDALVSRTMLPVPALMGVCLSLRIRKMINEHPGKVYALPGA